MVMEAFDDPQLAAIIGQAFLIAPDGQPLRWALRLLHIPLPDRCYGPESADRVCVAAAMHGLPIALYGGSERALADFAIIFLSVSLDWRWPTLGRRHFGN